MLDRPISSAIQYPPRQTNLLQLGSETRVVPGFQDVGAERTMSEPTMPQRSNGISLLMLLRGPAFKPEYCFSFNQVFMALFRPRLVQEEECSKGGQG